MSIINILTGIVGNAFGSYNSGEIIVFDMVSSFLYNSRDGLCKIEYNAIGYPKWILYNKQSETWIEIARLNGSSPEGNYTETGKSFLVTELDSIYKTVVGAISKTINKKR